MEGYTGLPGFGLSSVKLRGSDRVATGVKPEGPWRHWNPRTFVSYSGEPGVPRRFPNHDRVAALTALRPAGWRISVGLGKLLRVSCPWSLRLLPLGYHLPRVVVVFLKPFVRQPSYPALFKVSGVGVKPFVPLTCLATLGPCSQISPQPGDLETSSHRPYTNTFIKRPKSAYLNQK